MNILLVLIMLGIEGAVEAYKDEEDEEGISELDLSHFMYEHSEDKQLKDNFCGNVISSPSHSISHSSAIQILQVYAKKEIKLNNCTESDFIGQSMIHLYVPEAGEETQGTLNLKSQLIMNDLSSGSDLKPLGVYIDTKSLNLTCFRYNAPFQDLSDLSDLSHFKLCHRDFYSLKNIVDSQECYSIQKIGEQSMMVKSSIPENLSPISKRYAFAYEESVGCLDFSSEYIDAKDLACNLFLIDGVAYNQRDMSQILWAFAMARLGFTYTESMIGSEINGAFRTFQQNLPPEGHSEYTVILRGDSTPDQNAIKHGFEMYDLHEKNGTN